MRRTAALLAFAALVACGAPDHSNPFDPATPPALQARAVLVGRVTLEPTGATTPSPAGVTVSVLGLPDVTTAADGSWRVEQVPAGTYTVRASKDVTWQDAVAGGIVVTLDDGGKEVAVPDLHLAVARGSVSGTVQLEGEPAGAWDGVAVTLSGVPGAVYTDAGGRFLLAGVPVIQGSYALTASRRGWQAHAASPVNVALGQETAVPPFQLALDVSGGLQGTATVARPAGANDGISVTVSGTDLNGAAVTRATTTGDASGAWSIPSLPQGTYAVTFRKSPYDTQTATGVFLAAGQTATLPPVVLPVATAGIGGTVSLDVSTVPGFAAPSDRSGTVVTLGDGGTAVATAVTDPSGGYQFAGVPALPVAASYTVTAQRPYFSPRSTSVVPVPDVTVTCPELALPLAAGALSGTVTLWDDVAGAGANASSAGAQVALSGTAFDGVAWNPAPFTTPASGAWSFPALPPGTYAVTVTSAGRRCDAYGGAVVGPGAATDAGAVRCTDAVAPGPVGLGPPLATGGGVSGWVSGSSVTLPIAVAAVDGTSPASNLRAYQTVVGAAPDWTAATSVPVAPVPPSELVVGGLATDATNTVWVRAIDWTDNAGPAASVAVVQDSQLPPQPTITSARAWVADSTATVTFTGSDADPSFLRYEACTGTVGAASACPGTIPCAFAPVAQSYPVLLAADVRTCLWARAVDRAGNASPVASTSIVSAVAPPAPPVFRPSYDPAVVTVRSGTVDLFLASAATDPAWGAPWSGIGWIEVDTGAGFQPLCPATACHAGETYTPCATACGCTDPMLRCDGTTFTGLRIPLASASQNVVAVRAVNLAGTASSGLSQTIPTDTSAGVVAATAASETRPSLAGNLLTYSSSDLGQVIVDLGTNRRFDATDTTCSAAGGSAGVLASRGLLAYLSGGQIALRRPAAGASFCGADTTTPTGITVPLYLLGASGERLAYPTYASGTYGVDVREPGADGVLGNADDVTTTLVTGSSTVWSLQLSGTYALAMIATPTSGGIVHRVFSAPSGFAAGATTLDLPDSTNSLVALSPDGSLLAYTDTSTYSVVVRYPTAGRYGAGDATVRMPLPPGLVGGNFASIAVDGTHVVVADAGIGALVHWDAGPDGRFGTADDLYDELKPSKVRRPHAALSAGFLVYEEGGDLFAFDLTGVRWEDVPAGYGTSTATVAQASGSVFFGGSNPTGGSLPLVARCATGRDSGPGTIPNWFAASGDYVVWDGGGLWLGTRDVGGAAPTGCFFTGSSTTQKIFTSAYPLISTVLGETALAANRPWGTPTTTVTAIEPSTAGQPLTAGQSAVTLSTGIDYPYGLGLTDRQAVYYCGRGNSQICAKGKGAGGLFGGAGAPAEVVLQYPAGMAGAGTTIPGRAVKVSGRSAVIGAYPGSLLLLDAGPDGSFGTADDTGTVLLPRILDGAHFDVSGNWIAWVDSGTPGGDQIWLYSIADHSAQQLTFHLSTKTNVAVSASGRVWWEDSVLGTTWSLWIRTP